MLSCNIEHLKVNVSLFWSFFFLQTFCSGGLSGGASAYTLTRLMGEQAFLTEMNNAEVNPAACKTGFATQSDVSDVAERCPVCHSLKCHLLTLSTAEILCISSYMHIFIFFDEYNLQKKSFFNENI